MKTILLLLAVFLLLAPVRGDLDADKICGYGTARCRWNCKRQEFKIGVCPNTNPCCLKRRMAPH
uniref:Beta-defensin n=1 Tax=Myotis myotis TaxID=51298 RepID=A0A7J7R2H3_MYOMY|nr:defensin beta 104A [Myotis myotis]